MFSITRAALRGMCSLTAIRYDDNFRQLYDRFRDKGMNHYQAMPRTAARGRSMYAQNAEGYLWCS